MSTNKIALTSSMRSNLLSLKNTQKLFDSTQDKLSTGYKVNSAMDNPSSYFTAQSLNSRADDLNTLLDSIGQAVSTLQVTDQGITSLQDLVSQAKSIANSARDTANVKANTTSKVYFDKDALKSQAVTEAVQGTGPSDTMTIRFGDSTSMTGTTNVQDDTKLSGIGMEDVTGKALPAADANKTFYSDKSTGTQDETTKVTFNSEDGKFYAADGTEVSTVYVEGEDDAYDGEIADTYVQGSVKVDGTAYNINTHANENSMTQDVTYEKGSVFKIVANDDTTGSETITVEDADGNQFVLDQKLSDLNITGTNAHTAAVGDTVTIDADAVLTKTVSEDGKTTLSGSIGIVALTDDGAATDPAYVAGKATSGKEADSYTINVQSGSTVADMAKVMENMIGTTKVSVSVQDSKLNISTKDTTSVEVTGNFADKFGIDKGKTISLSADDTAESLRQKIDALDGVSAEFNEKGALVVKSEYGDDLVISGSLAEKLGISGQVTNGNNEHAKYAQQFNDVLKQIDELVQDTSYKGINLLNGDDLTVIFNESSTSKMELKGVKFDSTGLGFTSVGDEWKSVDSIDKSLQQISKATSLLRTQASQFGQQLSTIQVRQDFTENMVNQLQSGADKLVLADNNEEAANLLALQTRQSLGTKSLSLANQSAQSVLQLF